MKSFFLLLVIVFLASAGASPTLKAQARGPVIRPVGVLDHQRRMERRQLYRPSVKVVRFSSSRKLPSGKLTFEYSVKRGFVSRIEVRSGLKVVKILPAGGRAGRSTFTIDLSELPQGKNKFKLWAWQGQPAFQSVHGESISYTLTP